MDRPRIVCVLGCRSQSRTLERRARVASQVFVERGADLVVACGGRAWLGEVEADTLASFLRESGVPEARIVRERCSLDTRENARFAEGLLARRGLSDRAVVTVVTCDWHLPRAIRLFARMGLEVDGVGVEPEHATVLRRVYWRLREAVSSWKDELR